MPATNEISIALTAPAIGVAKEKCGPSMKEPTDADIDIGTAYGDGMPSKAPAAALVEIRRSVLFSRTPASGR